MKTPAPDLLVAVRVVDGQKIVLRTSNERSTSETVSDGREASCVIVNARTRIAADQP
jgi:hypothetical protein